MSVLQRAEREGEGSARFYDLGKPQQGDVLHLLVSSEYRLVEFRLAVRKEFGPDALNISHKGIEAMNEMITKKYGGDIYSP